MHSVHLNVLDQMPSLVSCYGVSLSAAEVVEHACGLATTQIGEFAPNVSKGIDSYSVREPLGVCAGICPSEFPAMIPLWVCLLCSIILFFHILLLLQFLVGLLLG